MEILGLQKTIKDITMPIEIDFQLFLPSLSVFYSYFEILKQHEFVKDVEIVQTEGHPKLRVHRLPEKFLSV